MFVDPEYLRQHYADLSDEALLAIHRAELVEAAQSCYDEELHARGLDARGAGAQRNLSSAGNVSPGRQLAEESLESGETPDWVEDAAEAFSRVDRRGQGPGDEIVSARDALEAAGIPCYLDLSEIPEEPVTEPAHQWRILVPGNLNLRATSVLERDIFNADFEAEWKNHLEMLSDEELTAMNPQETFCGLFDRVERVSRAYTEEIARRRLEQA